MKQLDFDFTARAISNDRPSYEHVKYYNEDLQEGYLLAMIDVMNNVDYYYGAVNKRFNSKRFKKNVGLENAEKMLEEVRAKKKKQKKA